MYDVALPHAKEPILLTPDRQNKKDVTEDVLDSYGKIRSSDSLEHLLLSKQLTSWEYLMDQPISLLLLQLSFNVPTTNAILRMETAKQSQSWDIDYYTRISGIIQQITS